MEIEHEEIDGNNIMDGKFILEFSNYINTFSNLCN